jgi:hypothetical protein
MSNKPLSKKTVLSIKEGTVLAIHINEKQNKKYTVKKVLKNMHLHGSHVINLLVESHDTGLEIELIVAERLKGISIIDL